MLLSKIPFYHNGCSEGSKKTIPATVFTPSIATVTGVASILPTLPNNVDGSSIFK